MKILSSDDWVQLCDGRPWYDQLMAREALDGETCLELCKNHKSCAKANWHKNDNDIGLCRMFTIGAAACQQNEDKPEYSVELFKLYYTDFLSFKLRRRTRIISKPSVVRRHRAFKLHKCEHQSINLNNSGKVK